LIRFPIVKRMILKLQIHKAVRFLGLSFSYGDLPTRETKKEEDSEIVILGHPIVTQSTWNQAKNREVSRRHQEIPSYKNLKSKIRIQNSMEPVQRDSFEISVIISIYRPGHLFDTFLGNIKEQTIFDFAEVILVLVDSIEDEQLMAKEFAQENSNVILKIINSRISIYEAWNMAISSSTAPLITNMNVDDLRAPDSLQTQVEFMKSHPWVDVGYQDFYYMLDRDLDWTSIVNIGAVSKLSPVTLTELAWFVINPPHNGPIWKRELHINLGLFDESLRSAGDYEFWMRVSSSGGIFAKMSKSTVGYFVNPTGMSTSVDSPSTNEEHEVREKYRKLIKLQSEKTPEIGVDSQYSNHPWIYSELLTTSILDRLKGVR
jgi:hypothetical protein